MSFTAETRIRDVTRYPDIADLYLAADVLVTDYSSVMFDFALTDKPQLLLVPDLEQYRDVERGFYFDLEEAAPGPMVTTPTTCRGPAGGGRPRRGRVPPCGRGSTPGTTGGPPRAPWTGCSPRSEATGLRSHDETTR